MGMEMKMYEAMWFGLGFLSAGIVFVLVLRAVAEKPAKRDPVRADLHRQIYKG